MPVEYDKIRTKVKKNILSIRIFIHYNIPTISSLKRKNINFPEKNIFNVNRFLNEPSIYCLQISA